MRLLRIREALPLAAFRVRLTLTNGETIERDLGPLLVGEIFEPIRSDRNWFQQLRAEGGTVVWPNGADLCPDVIIWGGPPPRDPSIPAPATLAPAPGLVGESR